MDFVHSHHATEEIVGRGIPPSLLENVLTSPEQKVPEHEGIICYQSHVIINDKPYLLRVMVDETKRPPVVVTAYRTSKISKYWRQI